MTEKTDVYDLIVLGGGPGGYEAAKLAGAKGLKTVLIEERDLGGVCLNRGCIPLKSFLHTGRIRQEYETALNAGLFSGNVGPLNQEVVRKYKDTVVTALQRGVAGMEKGAGVTVVHGHGEIQERQGEYFVVSAGADRHKAKNLIIATGSVENRLPFPTEGLPYKIIYSEDFLNLDTLPKQPVIIGGGVIGIECASYLKDAGSGVTIIEASDSIGGGIDSEIASALIKILKKQGIKVLTSSKVEGFRHDGVEIQGSVIPTDCVIVAVGRHSRIEGFGIENIGVQVRNKSISIDEHCRTNIPGVYACGDVTGKLMLAHVGYAQARVAVNHILGIEDRIENYTGIARIIYSNPEVLSVGLTGNDCKELEYEAKSLPLTYCGKYFAEHGKDGAVAKMVVSGDKMVGFSMIGNGASEIGLAAEMMIGMKVEDIEKLVFPHPTVGEIIHELCGMK